MELLKCNSTEQFISNFRKCQPVTARPAAEGRNRLADLVFIIQIESFNIIKDCLILPYLCSFNIKDNKISSKGNGKVALCNPKRFANAEDLYNHLKGNFKQDSKQSK